MTGEEIGREEGSPPGTGRRRFLLVLSAAGLSVGGFLLGLYGYAALTRRTTNGSALVVPPPRGSGGVSLEEAIARRRSTRVFTGAPITLSQLSQLLWAAQGVTDSQNGLRAAPSAGALYPLELYAVVKDGGVVGLQAGVYHYDAGGGTISVVREGDRTAQLQAASLGQEAIGLAPVSLVVCAAFERTASKYGDRGVQYVFQESGHAAENVYLQAAALGLGTVVMGAFDEDAVRAVVGAPRSERPVYVQPVGVPGATA